MKTFFTARSVFAKTLLTLMLTLSVQFGFAIDVIEYKTPQEESRFKALIEELRCMVCQNQNLADSDAVLAQDLRNEVLDLMRSGKSDDEIKTFLTERYGDFVLYKPPFKTETLLLWLGPVLVLGFGAILVFNTVRKRQRNNIGSSHSASLGEDDITPQPSNKHDATSPSPTEDTSA